MPYFPPPRPEILNTSLKLIRAFPKTGSRGRGRMVGRKVTRLSARGKRELGVENQRMGERKGETKRRRELVGRGG